MKATLKLMSPWRLWVSDGQSSTDLEVNYALLHFTYSISQPTAQNALSTHKCPAFKRQGGVLSSGKLSRYPTAFLFRGRRTPGEMVPLALCHLLFQEPLTSKVPPHTSKLALRKEFAVGGGGRREWGSGEKSLGSSRAFLQIILSSFLL